MSFNNRTRDSVYKIDNNGNRYPVKFANNVSKVSDSVKYKKTANNIDKYYIAPPQSPKIQTPQIQTPKLQTTKLQTPKLNTPQYQTPKIQTPKLQTPTIQTPPPSHTTQNSKTTQVTGGAKSSVRQSSPPTSKKEDKKMTKDEYRIKNYKSKYNYTKTEQSKQDLISLDDKELEIRFNGFIQIKEEDYRCIQPNTYIRYLKDGFLYRAGGKLVLNKWPKYWLLESVDGKKIRWSVPLKDTKNAYFQKDPEIAKTKKREEKARQRFHEAMMRGDYVALTKEEYEKLLMAAGKLNHKLKKIDYNSEINSDFNSSEYDDSGESGSESDYRYKKNKKDNKRGGKIRNANEDDSDGYDDGSDTSGNEENDSYYGKNNKQGEYISDTGGHDESSVDVRLTKEPLTKKKYI